MNLTHHTFPADLLGFELSVENDGDREYHFITLAHGGGLQFRYRGDTPVNSAAEVGAACVADY